MGTHALIYSTQPIFLDVLKWVHTTYILNSCCLSLTVSNRIHAGRILIREGVKKYFLFVDMSEIGGGGRVLYPLTATIRGNSAVNNALGNNSIPTLKSRCFLRIP